jgi:hypothetical protein
MNTPDLAIPAAAGAHVTLPVRKNCFLAWILLALLLTLSAAQAAGPDEDYLAVYDLIDQADTLSASGKTSEAYAKYVEAQRALAAFQKGNPGWNAKTVSFRLNYLTEKIAATSGKTAAKETSPATAAQTVTAAAKTAPATPKSLVKLLAAGSEPRTALRLHPAAGDKQTTIMTMKMAMATSVAGQAMPAMNIPAMVMTMAITVKDVSAAGDINYELVFSDATVAEDPDIQPAVAAAIKTSLASIRGLTGTGRMSDHGVVKSMEIKLPADAAPQLSQTLDQMKESFSSSSIPLPEEAVGPGAQWEYKTRIKSQGMTLDQTLAYELVSIEGDRITLRTTLTQNAANQKIQNPAMSNLKVDLNKMTGTGTGSSTYDLAHLMPVTGTLAEKAEINMSMNAGQQKQSMEMKMDMNITLESK